MSAQVEQVRKLVRGLLENTESFDQLPREERRAVALSLVKILDFLADPNAGVPAAARTVATAQADPPPFQPNKELSDRLAKGGDTAGQDFVGGAARELGSTFKDIVKSVDFPKFVSGLIEGVFSSIVKSSIKQMQAFSQMLESISKSVDQFAKETISDGAAREYLRSSYPRALDLQVDDEGTTRIKLKDGLAEGDMPNFQADLGLTEAVQPDEGENEAKIVLGAQLKMARQRQQHLATMVLMGINRIVVTEGEIKASVLFDVKSKDKVNRDRFANTSDVHTKVNSHQSGGGWFDDSADQETETRVATAYSEEKEHSASELEAKAKLSGSVTVKFKSETFPLERFASSDMLGFVNDKGKV